MYLLVSDVRYCLKNIKNLANMFLFISQTTTGDNLSGKLASQIVKQCDGNGKSYCPL